jgi:hypothetical protein
VITCRTSRGAAEVITSLQNEVKSKDGEKRREVETVQAATSLEGRRKYSVVLRGDQTEARNKNIYSLILKAKQNESTDAIKVMLKRNVNPTHLKVGVRNLKTLRDG